MHGPFGYRHSIYARLFSMCTITPLPHGEGLRIKPGQSKVEAKRDRNRPSPHDIIWVSEMSHQSSLWIIKSLPWPKSIWALSLCNIRLRHHLSQLYRLCRIRDGHVSDISNFHHSDFFSFIQKKTWDSEKLNFSPKSHSKHAAALRFGFGLSDSK